MTGPFVFQNPHKNADEKYTITDYELLKHRRMVEIHLIYIKRFSKGGKYERRDNIPKAYRDRMNRDRCKYGYIGGRISWNRFIETGRF